MRAGTSASAASIPDLIAAWLPLMRDALRKPASSPISAPPGNTSFGSDWIPPAEIARPPPRNQELRQRLYPPRRDRARAVCDALRAFEERADRRMRFVTLE